MPKTKYSLAEEVDELVTTGFVARKAKWTRDRMWRRLKALDREVGGGLLQNVSRGGKPHFLVGLRALKRVWPGLFADDVESLTQRVDHIEERLDDLTDADDVLAKQIGAVRKEFRQLSSAGSSTTPNEAR